MSRKQYTIPPLDDQDSSRFWALVQRSDGNGCWIWTGARNNLGYGRFKLAGRTYYAHRVAFALRRGESPTSINHRCGNRSCVNPDHLADEVSAETPDETREGAQRHAVKKPVKPNPEFPLFAHATGRWAKKIRGKLHYFGSWEDGPDKALEKYLTQKDALHAGLTPREDPAAVTVKNLVNQFLRAKRQLVDSGEMSILTWKTYHFACGMVVEQFGRTRLLADIRQEDFARLRTKMTDRGWGPVMVGNTIQRVRSLFKFAFESEMVPVPIRFGPGFKRPSKRTLRIEKAKKGVQLYTADEIHRMLAAASVPMKAIILLGINAGFGNSDCGTLPLSAVDMETGWVNHPRPKTGIPRRCKLWPETLKALKRALAERPTPKSEEHANLFFVTSHGLPWSKEIHDSPIAKEMRKLLDSLGIGGRRTYYTLRHTHRTVSDEAKDSPAADVIMGHEPVHMSSVYRERISDERIIAITDFIRNWLFGSKPIA